MKKILFLLLSCLSFLAYADQAFVQRKDVQLYINTVSKKYSIPKAKLEALFSQVEPRKEVINSINHPAEAMTWTRYQQILITPKKVDGGVKFWKEHAAVLAQVEKKYQVPASIIVATLGIESGYGANRGDFRVIDALSDLAFNYPKRSKFFQYELTEFILLTMVDHPMDPLSVKGSYAGAIGWPQFMPHSIRSFGVDHSGNGIIDLSNDVNDIIASVANYYHHHGWNNQQKVIAVPASCESDHPPLAPNKRYPYNALLRAGYVAEKPLPTSEKDAMLIDLPVKSGKDELWLCTENFEVIMRYNSSPLYAMAVNQLSQKISEQYYANR